MSCLSFLGLCTPAVDREKNFPGFIEWLHSNGVETSVVDIKNFPGCGYGLQATKDLKVSSKLMNIYDKIKFIVFRTFIYTKVIF